MPQHRPATTKYWPITALVLAAFALASALIAYLGLPRFGGAIVVVLVAILLVVVVRWHASNTAYQCEACGNAFEISILQDLFTPHMLTTKYVRCPACGRRTWAEVLPKQVLSRKGIR